MLRRYPFRLHPDRRHSMLDIFYCTISLSSTMNCLLCRISRAATIYALARAKKRGTENERNSLCSESLFITTLKSTQFSGRVAGAKKKPLRKNFLYSFETLFLSADCRSRVKSHSQIKTRCLRVRVAKIFNFTQNSRIIVCQKILPKD